MTTSSELGEARSRMLGRMLAAMERPDEWEMDGRALRWRDGVTILDDLGPLRGKPHYTVHLGNRQTTWVMVGHEEYGVVCNAFERLRGILQAREREEKESKKDRAYLAALEAAFIPISAGET